MHVVGDSHMRRCAEERFANLGNITVIAKLVTTLIPR